MPSWLTFTTNLMINKIEQEVTHLRKTTRTLLEVGDKQIVVYENVSDDEAGYDSDMEFYLLEDERENPIAETELEDLLGEELYEEFNDYIALELNN